MQAMLRPAARAAVLGNTRDCLVNESPTANWQNIPVIRSAPFSQSQGKPPNAAEDGGGSLKLNLQSADGQRSPRALMRSKMTWSEVLQ